jgi:3-dehydrosphinganine reductase
MNVRNVLITGGSSGLGLELARAMVQRGRRVVLWARNQERLDEAAKLVRSSAPQAWVQTFAVDVRDTAALKQVMAESVQAMGGLDLLINSAGILREGHFEYLDDAVHREVMEINHFGVLNCVRAALPYLKQSSSARILNVASVASLTGVFGYSAYCASKHALLGASDCLRAELRPQGICVQVACPSEFDSPMVDAIDQGRSPENRAHALTIPKVGVDVVARDILRGLETNDFMLIPGWQTRWMAKAIRHFPGISRWLGDQRIRSVYRKPA